MNVDLLEHWIIWGCLMVFALVLLAVAKARSFKDKIDGSYKGKKFTLSWLPAEWWAINYGRVNAVVVIVGLILMLFGCSASWDDEPPLVAKYCPAVMEDTIDMSSIEDRKAALAIEAQSKGIQITGDYAADVAAQGGEMTLVGSLRIEVDANCQTVPGGSWMALFSADQYPITGHIDAQGNLVDMGADFGGAIVNISGQIQDGKVVNGVVYKSWLPHIKGLFDAIVNLLAVPK